MARQAASEDHTYRVLITERREYADGRESQEYTEIAGPYRTKAACKGVVTRMKKAAEWHNARTERGIAAGWYNAAHAVTITIAAKIQRAATTWTDVGP